MRSSKSNLHCLLCGDKFKRRTTFHRHILHHKIQRRVKAVQCQYCNYYFISKLQREYHINDDHRCCYCDYSSENIKHIHSHKRTCHHRLFDVQTGQGKKFSPYPFKDVKAFQGYLRTYQHRKRRWDDSIICVQDYFSKYESKMKEIISHCIDSLKSIKVQLTLICQFVRRNNFDDQIRDEDETCLHYVNSNQKVFLNMFYYENIMSEIIEQCMNTVNIFEQNGSGWILDQVMGCDIRVAKFEVLTASCFVPIPEFLQFKRAIVNPQNTGNECFKWAFLALQHYKDVQGSHRERTKQYEKFVSLYDFTCVQFPASVNDIKRFEKKNSDRGFRINVFGYYYDGDGDWKLHVVYMSHFNNDKTRKIINLLYVKDSSEHHAHYMSIVNIDKVLGKTSYHKHFLCYNCLQRFPSTMRLEEHEKLCLEHKNQTIQYPDMKYGEIPTMSFKKYKNMIKVQFVIYADFECVLQPEDNVIGSQVEYQRHIPSGFSFVVVNHEQKVIHKKTYRGKDCISVFFENIIPLTNRLEILNRTAVAMLPLTPEESFDYATAVSCHICGKDLKNNQKTRDHCHITGKYRGAAHRFCNMKYVQNEKIPIVIHNFKNYDQHLLIGGIRQHGKFKVKAVPQNSEKFLTIICEKYFFIDSMMFLAASLDDLVKNLICDSKSKQQFSERFSILVQVFGYPIATKLSRKGVYPYEYIDSFDKFAETCFPNRKHFYSSLHSRDVDMKDYDYGHEIFSEFCSTLGDYHDLYMTVDTLLLACVFENFRSIALKNYRLDPCNYFSLAGYAWDSALLYTGQELELIVDPDMYNLIESGLRGGVSMITTRHATAYNKYIPNYVEGKSEDRFLLYIDKNNLYGEALLQPLPVAEFTWMSDDFVSNFTTEWLLDTDDFSEYGYIFLVDLDYPEELHETHDEYPLMPEKTSVKLSELSKYQIALLDNLNIKYSEKTKKLIPNLGPKTEYVVHYRNLKYYVSKGIKIQKVHKILRFVQSAWLKDYVLFNARLRREAMSEFEKNLYKFMVNSIFGKSMEQQRNRSEAVITSDPFTLSRLVCRSTFKNFQIINSNVSIVFLNKPVVTLDRPIYTAFTVLDLSKLFMYEWHYDKIKSWYGDNAVFLFTDTDSLAYCIYTKDLYTDLAKKKDEFDFSDYPKDHPLYSDKNKKVIGKMKDEANSQILTSFVGLAPKMYSFSGLNNLSKKAAKGVKKTIIKNKLRHKLYYKALKNQRKFYCVMNLIRSRKHEISTVSLKKIALHCFDSKRYILHDGKNTVSLKSSLIG